MGKSSDGTCNGTYQITYFPPQDKPGCKEKLTFKITGKGIFNNGKRWKYDITFKDYGADGYRNDGDTIMGYKSNEENHDLIDFKGGADKNPSVQFKDLIGTYVEFLEGALQILLKGPEPEEQEKSTFA